MTLHLHLRISGALLVFLAASHALFPRYFGWKNQLAALPTLTRQVSHVHSFFIALAVAQFGIWSLFQTDALLQACPQSRMMLGGMFVFWLCRLFVQLFVYDRAIWRGRRLYTLMHVVFAALWIYTAGTYGAAMAYVWN